MATWIYMDTRTGYWDVTEGASANVRVNVDELLDTGEDFWSFVGYLDTINREELKALATSYGKPLHD